MQLFIKFIERFYVVAHHVADGLGFEDFELGTEGEEERYQLVIRYHVYAYAELLVVVMLRGMERFILDIWIAVGRDAHDDMLDVLALRDSNADDVIEVLIEIDIVRFGTILTQHRRDGFDAVEGKVRNHTEFRIPAE